MNTKTCKRCGWVYPITQPGTKCLICGEPFEMMVCRVCGEVFKAYNSKSTNRCPSCTTALTNRSYHRHMGRLDDRFTQWLNKVKQVPADYPRLTEEQWLEACRYFDGCARCDSDEIDTRGFFVGRENGGKYCDWNIIPLCTRCAAMWQLDKSMFLYTYNKDRVKNDPRYRKLGVGTSPTEFQDNLENIIKYLEVKLDNAIRVSNAAEESAE